MSEEKKDTVELKDEELEKVSGGFKTLTIYSFDDGDCFENNYYNLKVIGDYKDVSQNEVINVIRKSAFGKSEYSISASELASYTYLGKNVF